RARVLDDDDLGAVLAAQAVLVIAHPAMARELGEQPLAFLRLDRELGERPAAKLRGALEAEHRGQRGIHRQQLAGGRRLKDTVHDVVEQGAEARLALTELALVVFAPNGDARELREPR